MDVLLKLPLWLGLLTVVTATTLSGLIVVTIAKKYLNHKLTKKHERVGRILFRVTAGLIALLISLSYANEQLKQNKIINSLENEASLIVNIIMALNQYNIKETKIIKDKLSNYVNLVIDDNWENIDKNPYFSETAGILIKVNKLIYDLPVENKTQESLKNSLINDVNQVNKLMQIRIYSQHTIVSYLFFILSVGLLFMWIFFSVYNLDFVSLFFLSLYNILIGIVIYFVFSLSNPFVGPLKVKPYSFNIIKTKGYGMKPN